MKNEEQIPKEPQTEALHIADVSGRAVNLEKYLKDNGFEIDTYYHENKRYRKEITDCQTLYVRIYSDINTIQEVEYEHRAITKFENEGIISFETIDTLYKLKLLLKALS